jgi:hypothetical protein
MVQVEAARNVTDVQRRPGRMPDRAIRHPARHPAITPDGSVPEHETRAHANTNRGLTPGVFPLRLGEDRDGPISNE